MLSRCKTVKPYFKLRKQKNLSGLLFALPWIIGFLGFQLYPLLSSAYYSFTTFNFTKASEWVGLSNYKELFSDNLFYKSMENTVIYTIIATPMFIVFALLLAILVKNKIRGRAIFRTIFFLPTAVPVVAAMMIWSRMYNSSDGIINAFLEKLGLYQPIWLNDANWAKCAVIIVGVWGVGIQMMIFLSALQEVPDSYYEAASIDGAGIIKQFFHITIPCIAHVLVYQVILSFINCIQMFTQSYVLAMLASGWGTAQRTPGGPENSLLFYSVYLYQNAFKYLKMGKACAMGWMLFMVIAALTILALAATRKFMDNGVGEE